MKKFVRLCLFTVLVAFLALSARGQTVVDDVGSALGSGNVPGVSRYFGRAVVLVLAGTQATYSKQQAEMVLRDFFSKNTPRSYQNEHSSTSASRTYAIGQLITAAGNYRTYFAIKQKNDGDQILYEIRLEK